MPGDDLALDEKRVYEATRESTVAFVASALGVARVELAGDQIGRFSLDRRCTATSIAGAEGRLVVGTESDVLVGADEGFVETGFGPATTVAVADGTPVAVSPDGTVAALEGDEWTDLGRIDGARRADGPLLATATGIVRLEPGLPALDAGDRPDVRDVAAAGPYAATADGLVLAESGGWNRLRAGDWTLVAATGERVHAIGDDGLLVRRDGEWETESVPVDAALADIAHGEALYGVTADGTVLVYAPDEQTPDGRGGWRTRSIGLRDVVGLAVP